MSNKKALIYGPMGLKFQTPIEIFDGMYEGWGFSRSDIAAHIFGSVLFIVQEAVLIEQEFLRNSPIRPVAMQNIIQILE